ncbi:Dehydrogenase orf1 [Psilocybe cubensis]|uniref:Dehydrogenase orf1 n=1 Tax=Psilocybe cubensis TaxID=181762 RepID=A0ACB8GKN5_PSICU|nr:Dehydrogenase orf1 [Psilocybe cubensis]KAH9476025.1 Dehydrogenase orf1 [Psilocybe cubensis]
MPNTSRQHLAAMVPSVGAPFVIEPRSTPTPGPNEVLIEVKSVAVNPLDYFQRYTGFHIDVFPAIIGSDVGGTIIEVGSSVSLELKPGTRVSAFAPTFLLNGSPNYGAFQERVLVPDHFVTPLPNGRVSFNEASILPMALLTAWTGIVYQLGIPTSTTPYKPSDKQGLLIWSGASSVGTMAVKEDGVTVQLAYHTTGDLQDTLKVLQRVKGNGIAKVASAPALTEESPKTNDIEIGFVAPTSSGPKFDEVIDFVFRVWLKERLERAEFSPSPRVQVIGKGLGSLQLALEE